MCRHQPICFKSEMYPRVSSGVVMCSHHPICFKTEIYPRVSNDIVSNVQSPTDLFQDIIMFFHSEPRTKHTTNQSTIECISAINIIEFISALIILFTM